MIRTGLRVQLPEADGGDVERVLSDRNFVAWIPCLPVTANNGVVTMARGRAGAEFCVCWCHRTGLKSGEVAMGKAEAVADPETGDSTYFPCKTRRCSHVFQSAGKCKSCGFLLVVKSNWERERGEEYPAGPAPRAPQHPVRCCPPCFDCPLYLFLSGCCCPNRLSGAWMELQITFPRCHAATQAARLP